jgi:hypothetical protein
MMGFHAVTLWQNETYHFLYHMNIIIKTREWERWKQTTLLMQFRGGLLPCRRNDARVCLSSSSFWHFGADDDVIMRA